MRWIPLICSLLMTAIPAIAGDHPLVIAHRGASGYLPEHTLEAVAAAHAMGTDYIEQDVVLTKDDIPIVRHDIHLEATTNVAAAFPERGRPDGRFYAVDFTLAEIKTLRARERVRPSTGTPVYLNRFPVGASRFAVPTLAEEIELIQGMNRSTGREVGIYVEIKAPEFHRSLNKDITRIVLEVLRRYGYRGPENRCFIQCFHPAPLKRLRREFKTEIPLIQLIGENSWNLSNVDYEAMQTSKGLQAVADYAAGIGPWMGLIITDTDSSGKPEVSSLVHRAHQAGLVVHPFTFRADALPDYAPDFRSLLMLFVKDIGVDGLFTDFPDRVVRFLNA